MMLPFTSFFAAILTLLGCVLSINVVLKRRKFRVVLGSGNHPQMEQAVRVFGNFIEYTPLFLVLFGLVEVNGAREWVLAVIGSAFFLSRLFHPQAILRVNLVIRFWTMVTTYTCLIALSILLLLHLTGQ
jgi:uncharacterized membrane protein YecN with MAPEG domain